MNSGTAAREAAHRDATRIASEERCLSCRRHAPSLPAHYPRHRGMGSGHAGWDVSEWVPLCWYCHEVLDARAGTADERARIRSDIERNKARGLWP